LVCFVSSFLADDDIAACDGQIIVYGDREWGWDEDIAWLYNDDMKAAIDKLFRDHR